MSEKDHTLAHLLEVPEGPSLRSPALGAAPANHRAARSGILERKHVRPGRCARVTHFRSRRPRRLIGGECWVCHRGVPARSAPFTLRGGSRLGPFCRGGRSRRRPASLARSPRVPSLPAALADGGCGWKETRCVPGTATESLGALRELRVEHLNAQSLFEVPEMQLGMRRVWVPASGSFQFNGRLGINHLWSSHPSGPNGVAAAGCF